ncbi:hypothetical protein [Streptomyces sp. NBC_01264]|uniref:hypothetical protein n=1 Tax=Streptomyces sp. NBC_01264 TaxID=2903804 RepID=UPI00225B4BA6|nr:hypothetical protein [Streptomyces sp. NBC_01264]MCX4779156.1 hypothetical protein [Streptomyces sp. NBC_01264]
MTESGQGGSPQGGEPWGPYVPAQPPTQPPAQPGGEPEYLPGQPSYGQPSDGGPAYGQHAYGYPAPEGPAYGYPQGHVVGPGYEGPGDPHGYGYPPLPEAATQYIPPVPAAPAHEEAATQFIAPVPAGPPHGEAATQYIPPVPAGPSHDEAATQFIPPVPAGPADPAAGFDGLFRGEELQHTAQLPPVQEPVLRRQPPQQRPHPQQQQYAQQYQQQPPQQQYAPPQQYQQQPPPYAEPPAPRKVSPAIIAAVVIGLAVVGLGVGALLSDGKAQNNDPAAVAPAPTPGSSAADSGEAALDPAQPQAVQLDKLLADSNDSRAAVIKAVEDIKSCSNLDQAATDLRDAARQRQELVTRLQELKVDKLPNDGKLTAALTKAWKSSAEADNSYADWADDIKGDGDKCKDGKAKTTDNASDGNKSSGDATRAKETAAGLWNSIAGKYDLTKRDKSQL